MGNHPYTTLIKVRKLLAVKIQKALYLVNDFAKIAKLLKSDCIETIFTMIYNKGNGYNILFLNVMKNNHIFAFVNQKLNNGCLAD